MVIYVKYSGEEDAKIIKWRVGVGSTLSHGQIIMTYNCTPTENEDGPQKFKTNDPNHVGIVKNIVVPEGKTIKNGDVILEVEKCSHSTVMKDMCAECGADLRKFNQDKQEVRQASSACVAMVHSIPELVVSEERALILGKQDEERLLKSRKLVLLVDLDQTLIHTTNDPIPSRVKDICHFQLYGPHSPWYHTRMRKGIHRFLQEISKLYELHICTFGARMYAHKIASLLDEDGKYFSHRILSRDECFDPTSKTANLKALFPCGDHLVCIIDDREDVWNFAPNLVHVKPYHFFQHTGDIHAPIGMSKWESDEKAGIDFTKLDLRKVKGSVTRLGDKLVSCECSGDGVRTDISSKDNDTDSCDKKENSTKTDDDSTSVDDSDVIEIQDDDDYLLYLEQILKTIHKAFYELYDQLKAQSKTEIPDLKNVIPYVRRKVLRGVNIVFSGVIPTNVALEQSRPFGVARSLGATVCDKIHTKGETIPVTTHVVAARPGTAKVNQAKEESIIKLVTPDWLWSCAERWEKVEEKLFPLTKDTVVSRIPPPHCSSPDIETMKRLIAVKERNLLAKGFGWGKSDNREGVKETSRKRKNSSDFMESYNPLLAFSSDEIAKMDEEVEDIFNDSDSDESGAEDNVEELLSNPSELKKSNKSVDNDEVIDLPNKKLKKTSVPEPVLNLEEETMSDNDDNDDTDWNSMGEALEREFLEDL